MNGTVAERFAKQRGHEKNYDGYVTFPSSCETVNEGKHVTGIDDIKLFLRTVVLYYSLEVFVYWYA
jgi:hypothetical protein